MALPETAREIAARMRAAIVSKAATPAAIRAALEQIPAQDRDAWVDAVLGIDGIPEDGPALPTGCVPYLPCPVGVLLRMIDQAEIGSGDVFVDVGAGVGRAAALTHLLTGADAIGVEVQPHLVRAAGELTARLKMSRLSIVEGDAAQVAGCLTNGSVFLLYCPFSGDRLARFLDALEPIARSRAISVCAVDLPLPQRPWLTPMSPTSGDLVVYRT